MASSLFSHTTHPRACVLCLGAGSSYLYNDSYNPTPPSGELGMSGFFWFVVYDSGVLLIPSPS